MHPSDGELRLYLDQALEEKGLRRLRAHLEVCPRCQRRLATLSERAEEVGRHLETLSPSYIRSSEMVYPRFKKRMAEKEKITMWQKIFGRPYRPLWITLGIVIILAVALTFPSVQAIANGFLGLFRVQHFTVVQVDPGNLPEQLGSSAQLQSLLTQDVRMEKLGEMQEVPSAEAASQLAGFAVRLPTSISSSPRLLVQPAMKASFKVDVERIRAILEEIGRGDIQIPTGVNGATVSVDVPVSVVAAYGQCAQGEADSGSTGNDPDQAMPSTSGACVTLVQLVSPTVSAPPDLDLVKIGQAFLEVLGMSPQEAAHFAANIDWATTLVIPIPRYGTRYQDVVVDGVNGTFIQEETDSNARQYLLMWAKDGVIYALTGPGGVQAALEVASSLK